MSIFTAVKTNHIIIPQKKVGLLTRIVSSLTIYFTLFLLNYSDFININISRESQTNIRFGGLFGGHTLSIPILIIVAFLTEKKFRKLLLGKIGILYGFIISLYLLIGFIYRNGFSYIKIDLVTVLWLLAGCAMFFIVTNSYRPKLQLFAIVLIPTILLIYSCLLHADRIGASDTTRILFSGIRNSWSLSILLSVALAVFGRHKTFWKFAIWALVIIHFYAVALSGTRSITLSVLTVALFSLLTLSYKLSQGLIGTKITIFRGNKLSIILLSLGFFLSFVLFSEFILELVVSFSNLSVFERLFTDQGLRSSQGRIMDAFNMFQSLNDFDFILGRGIGATYLSPDVDHGMTGFKFWFTHFGILSYWLKGGIVLFGTAIFFFYFKLPQLFIKLITRPSVFYAAERTALLTIFPGLFAYIVCMSTQATFMDYHSFWGLGFLFGAYSIY